MHTRLRVDRFCGHVMVCVSMGRGECRAQGIFTLWLPKLQTVMSLVQRMFQNINKEITVCIVEWIGHERSVYTPRTHIINANHTLQDAVTEEYVVFPGM